MLKLPQTVACTAQVLLHRFYCKQPMQTYRVHVMAASLFWLACKLEEVLEIDKKDDIRLRDVLMVFYRSVRRLGLGIEDDERQGRMLDVHGDVYVRYKEQVIQGECLALREFGFVTHVEHAHTCTLMVGAQLGMGKEELQYACNVVNDSLRRTMLCVQYRAHYVSCGALFLAGRRYGCGLPFGWWESCGVELEDLMAVVERIVEDAYRVCPSRVEEEKKNTNRESVLLDAGCQTVLGCDAFRYGWIRVPLSSNGKGEEEKGQVCCRTTLTIECTYVCMIE